MQMNVNSVHYLHIWLTDRYSLSDISSMFTGQTQEIRLYTLRKKVFIGVLYLKHSVLYSTPKEPFILKKVLQ